MTEKALFELDEILKVLPHRAPFLFVDRVLKLDAHKSILAERTLRPDEPQFAGHFPGRPIMPGVLVAEALAQTAGLLIGLSDQLVATQAPEKPKMFFLGATNVKFVHPAVPGDVLLLKATYGAKFGPLVRMEVEATAGRNTIATGSLTLAQVD